jgi:serine/threonine protein kinase
MHGDTRHEFACAERASQLAGFPPPIGHEPRVFRSCLVPGSPLDRLSPFGVEPEDQNIRLAQALPLPAAAGLLRLLEEAWDHLCLLQREGLCHGDTELKNFIARHSPLSVVLIDFESAVLREAVTENAWQERVTLDHLPLLREAVYIQCALGRQPSALASTAWDRAPELFRDGERFRRAITQQSELAS